ncbi:murein L,D-transpeptidase [Haoranjiania flava]|uniref:L,D-transpeptidase family protein n=1 Tax=Haoranjiania flava TaxID=1856322 RepID=A0AAE3IJS6_9BACT|nr:L,D-transpeptidase family protein [Haoranjiania flava]MCU7693078.1 L,D-transpeptidase family protein [Haoranjiania flava]
MRKLNVWFLLLVVITSFSIVSCKNKNKQLTPEEIIASIKDKFKGADTIPIDRSIDSTTAYNTLFLDSADVKQFMLDNPEVEPFVSDMIAFYRTRNFQYAWFDSTGMIEQASNFINVLNNNEALHKDSTLRDKKLFTMFEKMKNIDVDSTKRSEKNVLEAELRLTGQFFKFAQSTYEGKIDAEKLGWFIPKKKVDINVLFDSTVKAKNLNAEKLFMNPIYGKLQEQLIRYKKFKEEPWDSVTISKGKQLTPADSTSILLVKRRLSLFGDYTGNVDNVYDSAFTQAVKSYQKRYGLNETGVPDKAFVRSVNTPVDSILKKLVINLERAKWMPVDMAPTYAWVNIPEFKLNVYENKNKVFDMNVVVGSQANNTVIFTDIMEYVVFAPYWGVPASIVKKEILPAMQRNGNYLARNDMEITGNSGGIPTIRQKPGPKNSLGLVKFLFPNAYDIYFHDTPSKWAFNRSNRDLSHGCIRLEQPAKFAQWVLRYNPQKYSAAYIDSMMHKNTKETHIKINKEYQFPVYLVYFTSWVADDGRLMMRDDIYNHDKEMEAKLFI